jgi:malate synthase
MVERVERDGLKVAAELADFIEKRALPGTGVEMGSFWAGFSKLLHGFAPKNRALLERRAALQAQIDDWHRARKGQAHDGDGYKAFLEEIGYLVPEGGNFRIETSKIDPEIASVAGPQLVVPITNARFALNAANARWGSLYDALYGTDAMGSLPEPGGYDRGRGARVVARARVFLDDAFPIAGASHADIRRYRVEKGQLLADDKPLMEPGKFVGYTGHPRAPDTVLLRNNGLHVELVFDRAHPIGARDQALLADVRMESAISAIMDCEDSVACVDAEDKVLAYGNWLGLMQGDLAESFEKGGKSLTRILKGDRTYTAPDGAEFTVKGRALMLVRNVGHLMTNPAILLQDGAEAYEGLMDAMITTLIAKHDLRKTAGARNSVAGSVYVVKPKMHGPEEVAFADETFTMVEEVLGLPRYTVKLGIMDEERRTSVNLKECIRAAKHRVAFINTGFLDRTGDEIHTSMEAGPFSRKDFIKRKSWITAYENQNVDIGLECGLRGHAQIGKGMWAAPDKWPRCWKEDRASARGRELRLGAVAHGGDAACAALPPGGRGRGAGEAGEGRAAGLCDRAARYPAGVLSALDQGADRPRGGEQRARHPRLRRALDRPGGRLLQGARHQRRGLMEDRATCRISAQHIANWLHHGVVSEEEVVAAMRKMAEVVDRQNAGDPAYRPMAPGFNGIAFAAAMDLVLKGREQPSGYTEPVLHARRLEWKAA